MVRTPDGERSIHRAVGCVSSFGGSPLRQEIGLGDATGIVAVEVRWPSSGLRQVFEDVPMNRLVRIVEGRDRIESEELESIVFDAPAARADAEGRGD